ncbi:MAG: RNA polymerase-binding protein DksA [Steroidobacteraceae bacterium]
MAAKKTATKASRPKKSVVAARPPARKPAPPARKPAPAAKPKAAVKAAPARKTETLKPVENPIANNPTPPARERATQTTRSAPVNEVEDGESGDPGSLLAGPRNVQPYVAKRGEQYMSKQQTEHFRQILQSWKQDLMVEVDRTVSHMKDEAANFPDPNDRATQEEEFSLELRTRDRERKLIRKIEEAIKRLEDGSYGYCLETGEEIGIKRLEARPVATLSLEAQERRERREKQYGDRDDRYR